MALFEELLDKLHHPERDIRKEAVIALGKSEDDRALESLIEATQDDDLSVRYFARKGIIKLKKSLDMPTKTVDEDLTQLYIKKKIELLSASDLQTRLNAAKIILEIGDRDIIPEMVKLLKEEEHEYVISILLRIIGKLGDSDVISIIEPYLSYSNRRIRANAVEALGYLDDRSVMNLVTPFLSDPDNRVKANAAHSLWKFSRKKTLAMLKNMLKSKDESERFSAIFVLRELRDINGRKLLLEVMNDDNLNLRLRAAHAIHSIDEHLSDDISMLVMTVRDRKKLTTPRSVINAQLPILDMDDPQSRVKGGLILFYSGTPGDSELVATLAERLDKEDDSQMRATLYKALGRIGGVSVLHRLAAALQDNNPRIRANALEGLAHVYDPRVTDMVIPLLRDPNNRVKANAARVLKNFSKGKVLSHLKKMSETGPIPGRKSAIYMLSVIGENRTRSFLARLLSRKEPDLQESLTQGITRLSERMRKMEEKIREDENFIASDKMTLQRKLRLIKNQIELLTDRDFHVRRSAAKLLVKLMDEETVEAVLRRLETESNPFIRATLVKISSSVKETYVLDALERYLTDDDNRVRANTVEAIGTFETPRVVELVAPLLHDDEERVKINAAVALWKATEKDDFQKLLSTVRSLETSLKTSAASVLEKARTVSVQKAFPGKAEREAAVVPPALKKDISFPFPDFTPAPVTPRSTASPIPTAIIGKPGIFKSILTPALFILVIILLGVNIWSIFVKPGPSREEITREIKDDFKNEIENLKQEIKLVSQGNIPPRTGGIDAKYLDRLAELAESMESYIKDHQKAIASGTAIRTGLTEAEKHMVEESLAKARDALSRNNPQEVIDYLPLVLDIARKHPSARNVRYVLGVAYYQLGTFGKAIAQCEFILKNSPNDTDALLLKGKAYLEDGTASKAVSSFEQLAKLHPDDGALLTTLGNLYYTTHQFDKAEEILRVAVTKGGGTDVSNLLGNVYIQLNRFQEARNQFETVIAKEPESSSGYTGMGKVYYRQLIFESAEAQLDRALEINPNDIEALLTLANLKIDLKRWPEAQESAESILRIDPDNGLAHLALGRVYMALNAMKQAEHHILLSLDILPEHAEAYYYLGLIYEKGRDYEGAYSAYVTARGYLGKHNPDLLKDLNRRIETIEKKLEAQSPRKPRRPRNKRPDGKTGRPNQEIKRPR